MSSEQGCEGCFFYKGLQESVQDETRIKQRLAEGAPDASAEQIDRAYENFVQMAEGARQALPNCPGYHRKSTTAWYIVASIFGDKGDAARIARGGCNNPYINSDEFAELDYAAHPASLQKEALEARSEGKEAPTSKAKHHSFKALKIFSEGFHSLGTLQKVSMAACAAVAVSVLINHPGRDNNPPPKSKSELPTKFPVLSKKTASLLGAATINDAIAGLRFAETLSPKTINQAHSLRAKVALGNKLQFSIAKTAQFAFADKIDKYMNVDEYDLAHRLLSKHAQQTLSKDGYRLEPVYPIPCNASYAYSYNPDDYSNHSPSAFTVRAQRQGDKEVIEIPLGARQEPETEQNQAQLQYPFTYTSPPLAATKNGVRRLLPCYDYSHAGYPTNKQYLKIVY